MLVQMPLINDPPDLDQAPPLPALFALTRTCLAWHSFWSLSPYANLSETAPIVEAIPAGVHDLQLQSTTRKQIPSGALGHGAAWLSALRDVLVWGVGAGLSWRVEDVLQFLEG